MIYLVRGANMSYETVIAQDKKTIDEYEKLNATIKLFSELVKGEKSAKEKGWIKAEYVGKYI